MSAPSTRPSPTRIRTRVVLVVAVGMALAGAGVALTLADRSGPSQAEACRTAVQAVVDDFIAHGTQHPSINAAKLACATVPIEQVGVIKQAVWDANGQAIASAAVAQAFAERG